MLEIDTVRPIERKWRRHMASAALWAIAAVITMTATVVIALSARGYNFPPG